MRRSEIDVRLNRAGRRIEAANGVLKGRLEEFFASLMVGCEPERQSAREAVMAAQEALLDAFENNAWVMLERDGIDPTRRHL